MRELIIILTLLHMIGCCGASERADIERRVGDCVAMGGTEQRCRNKLARVACDAAIKAVREEYRKAFSEHHAKVSEKMQPYYTKHNKARHALDDQYKICGSDHSAPGVRECKGKLRESMREARIAESNASHELNKGFDRAWEAKKARVRTETCKDIRRRYGVPER